MRRRSILWLVIILATGLLLRQNWHAGTRPTSPPAPSRAPETAPSPQATQIQAAPEGESPIAQMDSDGRIRAALQRIASGEKLYRQDGTIFQNREGRLPPEPQDYYREYTVETPGASDRGARRIIRGRNGELYYTADHYRTFTRIDEEATEP